MTSGAAMPTPVLLDGIDADGWIAVSAGVEFHTCGLREDRSVWCWGTARTASKSW